MQGCNAHRLIILKVHFKYKNKAQSDDFPGGETPRQLQGSNHPSINEHRHHIQQPRCGPLSTSQEEADTILVLHGLDAAKRGLDVDIVSPDTVVFILALSRLPMLEKNPRIGTGIGTKKHKIQLKPVYNAIGPAIADALPSSMHSLDATLVVNSMERANSHAGIA